MDIDIWLIMILSAASFLAGFIDSIAGGGGLLLVPSLLIGGLPPQIALGTNKFAATLGTSAALTNFIFNKKVIWKIAAIGIVFALVGASIGSKAILSFDSEMVGKIIVFLLPIAIFVTLTAKKGSNKNLDLKSKKIYILTPIICSIVGFYDGFFGPGTGSFFIIAFSLLLGLNLVSASATSKVFNFISNLGALVIFVLNGKVIYHLGIPLAIANILGNYVGSHLVIKKGARVVKIFLIISLTILMISLVWKYFFSA